MTVWFADMIPRQTGLFLLVAMVAAGGLGAQSASRPVSRLDARAMAADGGPTLEVAAADTALGAALVRDAGLWADPGLATSWTKSAPQYHVELSWPIDLPGIRSSRLRAARSSAEAFRLGWSAAQINAAMTADTLYLRALEAEAVTRASAADATTAEQLAAMSRAGLAAGETSRFDASLAALSAARSRDQVAGDSLDLRAAMLALQRAAGDSTSVIHWTLTDSLTAPVVPAPSRLNADLLAADASARAADEAIRSARHTRWSGTSLLTGIEFGDPAVANHQLLPVIGVSIPIPLFNRGRGATAIAEAEAIRAGAVRTTLRRELDAQLVLYREQFASAMERLGRDDTLLTTADDLEQMAVQGYREGETGLAAVLEAARIAREIRVMRAHHLADAMIAAVVLEHVGLLAPEAP
ncbi:MAG: TolC family protein [Gemmatimonadota bacterium]